MLVLSRKLGQSIKLSSDGVEVELTVIRIAGNRVQVGLAAPSCVKILRSELVPSRATDTPPIPFDVAHLRQALVYRNTKR